MSPEKVAASSIEAASTLLELIRKLAAELHPRQTLTQKVTLDSSLDRDIGLDSLSRVELLARIEREFRISLPDRMMFDAESPRDFLRAIQTVLGHDISRSTVAASTILLGEAEAAPLSAKTLVEVLQWHVQAHPDRLHIRLIDDEQAPETLSYRQLWEGAEILAAGLQQEGIQPGDSVSLMLPTGRDYFLSFFAILLAGAIPVPIYPPLRRTQIEDHLLRHGGILSNCEAKLLITIPEAKVVARLLRSQVTSLHTVVTTADIRAQAGVYQAPAIGPEDTAFLQYTSGSTGNPKGVILTHANLLTNIRAMGEAVQVDATDVFVSWLPLYHDMGLIGAWLGSLYYAMLLIIMSPMAFLARPQRWLRAIHQYHGTLSAAPNFGYELCLKRISDEDIEGLDLSAWRLALNGAEPVSPDTLRRFARRFMPFGFRPESMMPVYGLAESSVGLAFPPLSREPRIDCIDREAFTHDGTATPSNSKDEHELCFVACGRPLRGHEIRIVDASGRELPERQEGHLQFRGPSATSGYYRNPEATQALFNGDWLNSGDLAYFAEGDVYITGRTKDLIIRAGRNIYPHELEESVGNIDGIRKGCVVVFGTTDIKRGLERLIVLAETRETDPDEHKLLRNAIVAHAADLVGTTPDEVILAPPHTVLKTSSGKLRRSACRDLYESGELGQARKAVWRQLTRVAITALRPTLRRTRTAIISTLYAAYTWTLFALLAPFVGLSVSLLPRLPWRWAVLHRMARFLGWATGTPLVIQGWENLPDDRQAFILVANHASYLDGYALVAMFTHPFSFVVKAEFLKQFFLRIFMQRIHVQTVERFDKQKGLLDARHLTERARHGQSLLFFPEGTFTRMPGLLPFHMGAFVAAEAADLPIIPIAIRGTRSILRANSWYPRRGRIVITVGEAIDVKTIKQQTPDTPWNTGLKLRDMTREQILRNCGEPDLADEKTPV